MPVGDDELRAAVYRLRYARRRAFQARIRAQLSGDPAALRELQAKTLPLIFEETLEDEPERLPEHANG
jgi:hypothetical protein